jgi:F0F1-type ATP synthase assembly protein I
MDRREFNHAMWHDVDSGWARSAEFLSAILVWFGIGWLLDRWLGTDPWLMAIGAMLGLVLGMFLMWVRHQHATQEDRARFRYRD